jgi:ribosome recycling factor
MVSVNDTMAEADARMGKCVEALARELSTIRTGRANPALIENLMVDYYGVPTPLSQISSISVPEARLLLIHPWDKQALAEVEKTILKSELGLVPSNDGTVIRITIPSLTEERRRELVRLVGRKVEDAHVAARNSRRGTLERLRDMEKDKLLSKDDGRRAQEQLQHLTDAHISQMDQLRREKEEEVMEV